MNRISGDSSLKRFKIAALMFEENFSRRIEVEVHS